MGNNLIMFFKLEFPFTLLLYISAYCMNSIYTNHKKENERSQTLRVLRTVLRNQKYFCITKIKAEIYEQTSKL